MRALTVLLAMAAGLAAQPLRLHPANPHYFEFRGKPAVLITSGEHYGAVHNTEFDFVKYLATLQADGLNLTRLFVGGYREIPDSFGIKRNTLAPREGKELQPWARAADGKRWDLDRWEPRFFERLKAFLGEAAKRGVVVEVVFTSSLYTEKHWQVHPFNAANNTNGTSAIEWKKLHTRDNGNLLERQEALARKLARELNGFDNFYFEVQNEPWSDRTVTVALINPYLRGAGLKTFPNSVDLADAESLAWQKHIAAVLAAEEAKLPQRHLIAQNYCNFLCAVKDADPNISIFNFHYAYPEAATLNYGWNKALSYDETGFIQTEPLDTAYRKEAWNFLIAGGAAFSGLDYSFTVGREDGTDLEPNGPGGGSPTLRKQLGILKRFIESFDFVQMRPDATVVVKAPGATPLALAEPGRQYAVYLTGTGPCPLELNLPAGKWSVEWIDTATGKPAAQEQIEHRGGPRVLTSPAFADDIALALRKR